MAAAVRLRIHRPDRLLHADLGSFRRSDQFRTKDAPCCGPAAALSAYLQKSNAACKLMFVDAAPMSIFTGAAIRRDIQLSAQGSVGAPPCDSAAPSQTPPAKQTPAKP